MNQHSSAAGIIVYQDRGPNKLFFLGLIALPEFQTKNKGIYDIPKGRIDPGESPLQCAIRECFEECSIVVDINDINHGYVTNGYLSLFLAYTDGIPHVTANQDTGILEHVGFRWVSMEDAIAGALDYLKPLIRSAESLK